jgi:hypothetical protein
MIFCSASRINFRICESSVSVSARTQQLKGLRTWRWVVLQQLEQLDQYPRTWHLVVEVTFGTLIVHDYPLQPVCSFYVASLVLFGVVLDECGDERGYGKGHAHVGVVHEGYYPFRPFVLYDGRMFTV